MKEFLKKYGASDEMIEALEKAYKEANAGTDKLPLHISKARLDEEITKKKQANDALKALQDDIPNQINTALEPYKNIPKDWDEQLKKEKEGRTTEKTTYEKQLAEMEKLYGVKVKSVKAVRALIAPDKDFDKELERVQKEAPYLFGEASSPPPKGTGKAGGAGKGGDDSLNDDQMRKAIGLPTINKGE